MTPSEEPNYLTYQPAYFKKEEVQFLDRRLIYELDQVRSITDIPMLITSGYRHGDRGAHGKGMAADIRSESSKNHFAFVSELIKRGFRRIGVYIKPFHCPHCKEIIQSIPHMQYGHVHADLDTELPQDVLWMGVSK